jgi:hypothetical protein
MYNVLSWINYFCKEQKERVELSRSAWAFKSLHEWCDLGLVLPCWDEHDSLPLLVLICYQHHLLETGAINVYRCKCMGFTVSYHSASRVSADFTNYTLGRQIQSLSWSEPTQSKNLEQGAISYYSLNKSIPRVSTQDNSQSQWELDTLESYLRPAHSPASIFKINISILQVPGCRIPLWRFAHSQCVINHVD